MRRWFITGVSSGLGRALAEAALARGDAVTGALLDRADLAAFEALAPGRARPVLLDVTDLAACDREIEAAGDIDILVNNAGYGLHGVVEATSLGQIRELIEIHLVAPIALIQAVLPGMRARRTGHILNMGSLAARTPGAGAAIYAAAKAGIEALSVGLASEVAPFGIRVTTLAPGGFRTGISAARRHAEWAIADYAEADSARLARLATVAGRQRGDPTRAAAAILAMLDSPEPPQRFPLGPDAVASFRDHATVLRDAAERWAWLGAGTDFEAAVVTSRVAATVPEGRPTRSWFVTGVSSGLGRAIAEAALARGDAVTGTLRDPTACARFAALAPGRARPVLLDVTEGTACAAAVAEAPEIDVLVNNAGYSLEGAVEATSFDALRAQLEVHLIAPIALIQAALPRMRARRSGHIITIGSLAAHVPSGGSSVYAAAKAAVEALSAGLAGEVAPFGIRVTTIVPGAFRTGLGTSRRSATARIADYEAADAARRAWLAALSGHQRGDPARAAAAILALVDSPEPALRLAIGPDAIDGLRRHAADLLEEAERWEGIGGATDFE